VAAVVGELVVLLVLPLGVLVLPIKAMQVATQIMAGLVLIQDSQVAEVEQQQQENTENRQ